MNLSLSDKKVISDDSSSKKLSLLRKRLSQKDRWLENYQPKSEKRLFRFDRSKKQIFKAEKYFKILTKELLSKKVS